MDNKGKDSAKEGKPDEAISNEEVTATAYINVYAKVNKIKTLFKANTKKVTS